MNKDEALKLALEALKSVEGVGTVIQWKGQWELCHEAIAKCEEALAQPEEPVQEPIYAGVRMWVGDRRVMQGLTKLEFTRAVIEPQRLLELIAERCIKEVNNGN
jgi:hypothetical protein